MLDSEKEKAMGRNRKTYSESFRKQVAIEAMDGKKTVAEIAASNNIAPGMVSAWKKAFINGEFSKDLKKAQKENEELKKQLDAATLALGKAQLMIELIKKSESQGLNLYELVDEDSAKKESDWVLGAVNKRAVQAPENQQIRILQLEEEEKPGSPSRFRSRQGERT